MTQPHLSIQLYTVRDLLRSDLDGTLTRLAQLGLKHVEPYDLGSNTEELAQSLNRLGLLAKTGHAGFLSGQEISLSETFRAAKLLGVELIIDPFVAPERWLDRDAIDDTAKRLNEASVRASDQGLRVGYHNHTQEFQTSVDGLSGFEYFVDQLHKEVDLEIDLYGAATARLDGLTLLENLGTRVRALHVKDGLIGEDPFGPNANAFSGQQLEQRPAGRGEVPILDFLAATPFAEYAVIEFDSFAGDIFDAIGESVAFFQSHGIR
jgi:sugar phosphate isomerase/epimerase